eukprot:jgi/Chlat1/2188/Chrsp17S02750
MNGGTAGRASTSGGALLESFELEESPVGPAPAAVNGAGDKEDTISHRLRSAAVAALRGYKQWHPRVAGLLLGQGLSVLITLTGISSQTLSLKGIDVPTTQSFANYVLLAVVYGSIQLYRRQKPTYAWWKYAILGLLDVEANFLGKHGVPCVLALTTFSLGARYSRRHYAGVALCLGGIFGLVITDVTGGSVPGGPRPMLGDALCLMGAVLYAISNVWQEKLLGSVSKEEILSMIGCYGGLVSLTQLSVLERGRLAAINWQPSVVFPFILFFSSLFAFYSLVPVMLLRYGSAMFNLSLLTSDGWAVVARTVLFQQPIPLGYFGAFAVVAAGLGLYNSGGLPMHRTHMALSGGGSGDGTDDELAGLVGKGSRHSSMHDWDGDDSDFEVYSWDNDLTPRKV